MLESTCNWDMKRVLGARLVEEGRRDLHRLGVGSDRMRLVWNAIVDVY